MLRVGCHSLFVNVERVSIVALLKEAIRGLQSRSDTSKDDSLLNPLAEARELGGDGV
jgi:hypothetical protein